MLKGIDVSSVQGVINWYAVKASGIDFAIVKCYQGNDFCDPFFARNIAEAKAAGLKTACYQFPYPLRTDPAHPNRDPISQANLHFKASRGEITFIDCEWPAPIDFPKWSVDAAFIRQWLLTYLVEYERLSGRKPLIYSYPDWAAHVYFELNPEFADYKLWIASYGTTTPPIPKPWNSYAIWQTGQGKLPSGAPVDLDICVDPSVFGNQLVSTQGAPKTPQDAPPIFTSQDPVPVLKTPPDPLPGPANGIPAPPPPAAPNANFWQTFVNALAHLFGGK